MKKYLIIAFVTFGLYTPAYSQVFSNFQGKQYEQKNNRWYDEHGNIVNSKVITIKLKNSSLQTASIEFGRRIRENALGYIDIELSNNIGFFEQLSTISEDPNFESVDINTFGMYNAIQVTPNDPQLANQWYIDRIQARNAWNHTMGGECVVVGVLDSGVDWEHEDLGIGHDTYQNIWLNPGEDIWSNQNNPNTGNGIDDDTDGLVDNWKGWNYDVNSNDVRTGNAHGTQVSGIISAKANNGRGIAGIAGGNNNDGVKVLGLCIGINAPDGSVLDDAILHAVDKGVRIIQISASVGETSAINAAIQHAVDNGVVVVCASGNSTTSVSYPASNSNVISVGATDQNDQKASFSNFGNNLVLAAPGVNILTTTSNNEYGQFTGTSCAAPMVSATIALMISINPTLTPAQIRNIVISTSDKVGGYTYINGRCDELGFGRLNTYAALAAVLPTVTGPDRICTTNTNFTLQNVPAGQTVSWAVSPIHLFPTTGRSGTGATAALRAMHSSSSGLATLTYTIDTGCGEFQVQKQIWVGVPDTGMQVEANYYPICMNEYTYINAFYDPYNTNPAGNKASDITNFIWEQPSGVSCFTAGTKNEVLACWFTNPDNYIVRVRAVNSCGQGALRTVHFNVDSWGCSYFSVGINPNPANGNVTIALTETPLDDAAKSVLQAENKGSREFQQYSFNTPPHRIRVVDIVGAERLCVENVPEGNSYQLDISHLTPGIYIVHLEHRNGTVVRQLRVE